ncbi:AAA family ATPase [Iningainema sp. BLCCT55]|uniref:histidine kinase n=2 Tax=Iningainema TaxID=1932705 RepID=A0A8J6XP04_9CYAN|nr:AAA family ATPase [Iningainema tapete BLCC-T55]
MVALTGYQIKEQIYNGTRTQVYRGVRELDQKPVVIKLLRREYPTFNELVQFRNQYTIAKNLDIDGIIKTYNLENHQNSYALIMEDFGGVSLQDYITNVETRHGASLQEFLHIALQIVTTLYELYRHRVIHKDIKPANILINPSTKQVKLIDFSIASLLPRETQTLTNPNILEGTLAYLSPEQTGRMNRGIDFRSDFYSLGVTFFELLTGQLPFVSDDPMDLVYCHLAKLPPQVHHLNPDIPPILSEIISKLMAKNAEDRYQSALGLQHDLLVCLQAWNETGTIYTFKLGQSDQSDRFMIPEKLYGREAQVKELLDAFARVAAGKTEMVLVAGLSGIGKTAVINEVHKPIVKQRGYFIKGKFDQLGRNVPLSAFVQAFRDLMLQLLSETDAQLQQWKTKILAALGTQGRVIIDVIPELEKIIGQQPPIVELSGSAAQNRFNLLLPKFIQVFTTLKHPLVIFIDDLQWADSASLNLMQLLMNDRDGYLLFLGTYRDNEVKTQNYASLHPLMLTLQQIQAKGVTINTITLTPLQQSDLNHLVADTLNCTKELALPLTELVFHKTQGNPFFSNQFLKALYEDGLINFNPPLSLTPLSSPRSSGGQRGVGWQCDIAQVKALALTDDVVEFMALQLQKLPQPTQAILKLAACIGNQFDLNTLSIVYEKSQNETAADLWKAMQEGLVIPTTEVYKFYQEETANSQLLMVNSNEQLAISNEQLPNYKFLHDRVQQAAYSLIPADKKQLTHLTIGRLLLKNTEVNDLQEKICQIVNQLNAGVELITQQAEREELAQLNLIAVRKAKAATAYGAAIEYVNVGIKLLADSWEQYELSLALYELAVEAAYLYGSFDLMEQLAETVFNQAKTLLDKIKVYEIKIQAYTSQNKLLQSIAIAQQLLLQFGVSFPDIPTQEDIQQALQETKALLAQKTVEDLIDLPLMTDAEQLAIMRIVSSVMPAIYIASPILYPLMILSQVNASIQHGNAPFSAFFYASYGVILNGIVQDIEAADLIGRLALGLMKKINAKEIKSRTLLILGSLVLHGKSHLRKTLPFLLESYQVGLETGDLEFVGYAVKDICQYSYLSSLELEKLEKEIRVYSKVLVNLKQVTTLNYCHIYWQAVLNLLGRTNNPYILSGEVDKEEKFLPLLLEANDLTGLHSFYVHKLILCYMFCDSQDLVIEIAAKARHYLAGGIGYVTVPIFHFYDSLTALAGYSERSTQKHLLEQVADNQLKLQKWAYYAPMNYLHKFYLVEAERYRVLNQKLEAMEYYDKAIVLAKENEYLQEEALANELAAKFYLQLGKDKIAQVYLTEAYYCYARWGAIAKINDLEKYYGQLLTPILQRENRLNCDDTLTNSTHQSKSISRSNRTIVSSSTSVSAALDLATVIKASLALSSEIELDKLLSALMQVVLENVAAQKCALIMIKANSLVIEAMAIGEATIVLQSTPVDSTQEIPTTLINYVNRTLETLVIDDATIQTFFASDRYINQQQPKSILCTPILTQGKLIAILYLENKLTAGVFTSDRLTLINLLCSQAAISLENARLYQQSQDSLENLKQMQLQLVQNEKMSALGNLVAGVAHEINNPVGFIAGNLQPAKEYIQDLINLINLYQQHYPNPVEEIENEIEAMNLEFLQEDLPKLISSMKLGIDRIRNISTSLRTFSRADTEHKIPFNIHEGIDSTILILQHRLKATETRPAISVIKDYGDLPQVECFGGQLNQVFMNLLANAIDAIEELLSRGVGEQGSRGEILIQNPQIWIRTEVNLEKTSVVIRIQDNGVGMTEEVKQKIFEHLYTTKPVGKGTGLGLTIARQIVVEKHGGTLTCQSEIGKGTEFAIAIPMIL